MATERERAREFFKTTVIKRETRHSDTEMLNVQGLFVS